MPITNYNTYKMNFKEIITTIFTAAIGIFIFTYIFFNNVLLSLFLCIFSPIYMKTKVKKLIQDRKDSLILQFRDMLYALSSSLSAGKTLENSFKDTLKDLSIIYPDQNSDIILEAKLIIKKLELNQPIDGILYDFAERAGIEDIKSFADVINACKKSGGNLIEITKNTCNVISEKIDIYQDIKIMLSGRKLEQKVLNFMPIVLILLLKLTVPDYISPIYSEIIGKFVMLISITLLGLAYFISKKIMTIKI